MFSLCFLKSKLFYSFSVSYFISLFILFISSFYIPEVYLMFCFLKFCVMFGSQIILHSLVLHKVAVVLFFKIRLPISKLLWSRDWIFRQKCLFGVVPSEKHWRYSSAPLPNNYSLFFLTAGKYCILWIISVYFFPICCNLSCSSFFCYYWYWCFYVSWYTFAKIYFVYITILMKNYFPKKLYQENVLPPGIYKIANWSTISLKLGIVMIYFYFYFIFANWMSIMFSHCSFTLYFPDH